MPPWKIQSELTPCASLDCPPWPNLGLTLKNLNKNAPCRNCSGVQPSAIACRPYKDEAVSK